jgi:hypothetical protein
MPSIFEPIRDRVSLEEAIQFLGLKLTKQEGDQLRYECPHCRGSNKRALSVNPDKGFRCFASSKSGNDATALVAHCKNISQREAARMLADHFGLEQAQQPLATSAKPAVSAKVQPGLQPLDYLETEHEVADMLGLTPKVLEALGGGFAPKGTMVGRLLIPLRLPNGTLVGFLGIATKEDQEPLLKFPPNLDEMCSVKEVDKPAQRQPDALRKLFRVVG